MKTEFKISESGFGSFKHKHFIVTNDDEINILAEVTGDSPEQAKQRATQLCTAVNNHEEMKEALLGAKLRLQGLQDIFGAANFTDRHGDFDRNKRCLEKIDSVLSQLSPQ